MKQIKDGENRRQVRFQDVAGALASLTLHSMRSRAKAGWLPELPSALGQIDAPQSGTGHAGSPGADGSPGGDGGRGPDRSDGADGSIGSEMLVLHLAALDIALQVDGRFNGLHVRLLRSVAGVLATSHPPPHRPEAAGDRVGGEAGAFARDGARSRMEKGAGPRDEDDLQVLLRKRLPSYLVWMRDFVVAQLVPGTPEPRQVLGLKDPADSAVVIVALSELVSLYHATISAWDLVE